MTTSAPNTNKINTPQGDESSLAPMLAPAIEKIDSIDRIRALAGMIAELNAEERAAVVSMLAGIDREKARAGEAS